MKRSHLAGSVATCLCIGLATPLLAAEAPATATAGTPSHPSPGEMNVAAIKPAEACLTDLRAFNSKMEKGGYWLGESGYGYGYPMGPYGYGYATGGYPGATGYQTGRPGYEVRTLIASANILAQRGDQKACEDVLTTSREIYKTYVAELHNGGVPTLDVPGWQQQQLAAAQPVTSKNTSFRSDELLGTAVRSPQDEALGSVYDLVLSPRTGKIAYLVIARGGIFGIDKKYVPVPWEDFKVTANGNVLVLDATKSGMESAPHVNKDQFTTPGHLDRETQAVDAYWKTHLSNKASTGSNG
jgi:sporulation protein YlmC with PRC-barrel domain